MKIKYSFVFLMLVISLLCQFTIILSQEDAEYPHSDEFEMDCELCHTDESWQVDPQNIEFNHEQETGFSLKGKHNSLHCKTCHSDLVFEKNDKHCFNCHTDIHHGELGTECENCHTPDNWINYTRMRHLHNEFNYPLTGAHKQLDCEACHYKEQRIQYKTTPVECFGCHLNDYNTTDNPDHKLAGFSLDCQSCHYIEDMSWNSARFEHTANFGLTGPHNQQCSDCHTGVYSQQSADCFTCHQNDYMETQNPNHSVLGFPTLCETCHSASSWDRSQFDHSQVSGFTLLGVHTTLECTECHVNNQLTGLAQECYDCHINDFTNIIDPNHVANNFDKNCLTCHSVNNWDPIQFDHLITGFSLDGAHKNASCSDCHTLGYNATKPECYSCHQTDFESVSDPNHVTNNFSHECSDCHSMNAFSPAQFDHATTLFPLEGAHTSANCIDCHSTGYINIPTECYSCHQTDFESVTEPNHVSNNFSHECSDCHSMNAFSPAQFDHAATLFPLEGAHTSVNCIDCHSTGYSNIPTECYSCHQTDFESVTEPNHVTNNFSHICSDCHSMNAFSPAQFDHAATLFPLEGAHTSANCIDCHSTGYTNIPTECYSCHQTDFESVTEPNHVTNNFSHICSDCHSMNAFSPAQFDHAATLFPLEGAHTSANCIDCHSTGYSNIPTECYSCHQADFESVTEPNHVTNNFSHICSDCHSMNAFSPAQFDHAATLFPLEGAHTSANCIDCHSTGYTNIPTECFSCHQADFESVSDPNHVTNNFSHECLDCHSMNAFSPAQFDHATTLFPLEGAHTSASCIDCHSTGYSNIPTECYSCHQADFESVTDPNHAINNFSHECTDCHSMSAFTPAQFDHATTLFPLEGAHTSANCIDCHSTGYTNIPTECYSCHQTDFESVTDPNHVSNNFSHECLDCHSMNAFSPTQFDHAATLFPLEGAHTTVNCIDCHSTGYTNIPIECYSCHQTDFESVTDPNHISNNFSHECTDCHSMNAFSPAQFDHAATLFPLEGAHTSANCIDCHSTGYTNIPTECYSCHQTDFESVTDPNHVSNNFSHECTDCHSINGWIPAFFDHTTTSFTLTGAHLNADCSDCHSSGYDNTPTDCYSCHMDDYNGTNNPNHSAAHFPTTCNSCHNTSAWRPANWDHDRQYFPIYSGEHAGEWNTCNNCHVATNDYSQFECINCHEHTRVKMDDIHDDESGYVYESSACYACHPRGYAEDD